MISTFQLSDGSFNFARADGTGEVAGGFGFTSPEGNDLQLEYTAGM